MVVIDASVALPWFFADEKSDATDRLLEEIYRNGASVPALWHIEVANALMIGWRRGRLSETDLSRSIAQLAKIPVRIYALDHAVALSSLITLASTYNLTVYDALYLEIAIHARLPLATFDRDLLAAAPQAGVSLLAVR